MKVLDFLYNTVPGRIMLKPLSSRALSGLCGRFMDTKVSKVIIEPFVKYSGINKSEYDLSSVESFNSFFYRPVKSEKRPICRENGSLIAPCDGYLTAIHINNDTVIHVKQSKFTISRLLGSEKIAKKYEGGMCLVFRLCVDNYHRYCYVDSGYKSKNRFIPGVLHTVRPVAIKAEPVFTENCRDYCLVKTQNFGTVVQMEVGAMLVGKINNKMRYEGKVIRGEEKGYFEYGGSTIIVLLKNGKAAIADNIIKASAKGVETPVKMGEIIGTAMSATVK